MVLGAVLNRENAGECQTMSSHATAWGASQRTCGCRYRTQEVAGSSPASSGVEGWLLRDTAWATSQETETVRDFYEAVNRRDFEQAERYFHPEVEIYPAIGGELDARRRYRGREEGRRFWNGSRTASR